MLQPIIRKEDILIPTGKYVPNNPPIITNNKFKSIIEQSNSDHDEYDYEIEKCYSDTSSESSSSIPLSHKTQDLIEYHLPNNDITKEFSTFSTQNKIKIIELGLATLNTTNDKRLQWNNKTYAEKINQIKNNVIQLLTP